VWSQLEIAADVVVEVFGPEGEASVSHYRRDQLKLKHTETRNLYVVFPLRCPEAKLLGVSSALENRSRGLSCEVENCGCGLSCGVEECWRGEGSAPLELAIFLKGRKGWF
jgi:hypothetical protein